MHVGALPVNRRQRLRREIVDLDHLRNGFMRSLKLLAVSLGDDALLDRLFPVMQARGAHLFGNIFRRRDQKERLFQPGDTAIVVDRGKI